MTHVHCIPVPNVFAKEASAQLSCYHTLACSFKRDIDVSYSSSRCFSRASEWSSSTRVWIDVWEWANRTVHTVSYLIRENTKSWQVQVNWCRSRRCPRIADVKGDCFTAAGYSHRFEKDPDFWQAPIGDLPTIPQVGVYVSKKGEVLSIQILWNYLPSRGLDVGCEHFCLPKQGPLNEYLEGQKETPNYLHCNSLQASSEGAKVC